MEGVEAAFPGHDQALVIKDLLWACVVCGAEEGVGASRRGAERCAACGAEYSRGTGAEIVVKEQGRDPVARSAGEWITSLPPIEPAGSSRAQVRVAVEDKPIYSFGSYMGRYELMGPPKAGVLELDGNRLRFIADEDIGFDWALLELSAIQMSSSTLQLKAKRQPVVTIRFKRSSAKLWEERLQAAVRDAYARAGLGDIVEFQPRIATR